MFPYINCDEIFEAFTHFETFDVKMARVKEVIHPLSAIVVRLHEWKDRGEGPHDGRSFVSTMSTHNDTMRCPHDVNKSTGISTFWAE